MNYGIRVQYLDGTYIEQIGIGIKRDSVKQFEVWVKQINPGRVRVGFRNFGKPECDQISWPGGNRVWISLVAIGAPDGWLPQWAMERDTRNLGFRYNGMNIYTAIDKSTRWPTTPFANGQFTGPRAIPGIENDICIEGGQTEAWDFVNGNEIVPDINSPQAERVKKLLGWRPNFDYSKHPRLVRLLSLFTISPESYNFNATDRDLAWWFYNHHKRFTLNSNGTTRIPPSTGWYDWGMTCEAADGPTNGRYDIQRWVLESYLLSNKSGTWQLAYLTALRKAFSGFIWSDVSVPGVTNRFRYETGWVWSTAGGASGSGERSFVGRNQPPRYSHEWATGLLAIAILSNDPDLIEVCNRYGDFLLTQAVPDLRHYGVRSYAWCLENLYSYYKLTDDIRYKNKAEQLINNAWAALKPNEVHWPDDSSPGYWWPWQEGLLNAILIQWSVEGLGTANKTKLASFIEYAIINGTQFIQTPIGECLQTYMAFQPPPLSNIIQGPSLTAFMLPSIAVAAAWNPNFIRYKDAAVRTVTGLIFQQWSNAGQPLIASEANIDCSANGFAGLKILADFLWGARPWCLS